MRYFLIIATAILIMWLSAVGHEKDMVRNFNETGDAKCWFGEIKR